MPDQPDLLEREREQIFLHGALDAVRNGNEAALRAIFITGPEGSGRSVLLTTTAREARRSIKLAVYNFRWSPGENGLTALTNLLGADETGPLYPYLEAYRERVARAAELERRIELLQLNLGIPDLKKLAWGEEFDPGRYRTVQALPPRALHFLLRRIYNTYDPSQMSEQAAAFIKTGLEHIIQLNATNLGQLRAFVDEVVRVELSEEDWQFYLKPEEHLARELGYSLNGYVQHERPLILLFDDYRPAESDRYLRQVIETTQNTLWIFATPSRPAWSEKLADAAELRLDLLGDSALAGYFNQKYNRALSADETAWLASLTRRTPLALYIAGDLYAHGTEAAILDAAASRTPDDYLGGLFLYFLEESGRLTPEERAQLYALAILREPTPEFLAAFGEAVKAAGYNFDPALVARLFEKYPWLADQAESAEEREQPALHPALKERLRRYLMLERRRFSQPVQEGILEPARNAAVATLTACEERLVAEPEEQGSVRARAKDLAWGKAVEDLAYYRLWLDEAMGWVFLLPRWMMAFGYNRALAHRLLKLAESMEQTYYTEGAELLPVLRTLLNDSYSQGRKTLEEKLQALTKIETVGVTSGRSRWFKSENLGMRPEGKGSAEAELKGLVKWAQAQVYEEAGQYEKAAPLYEEVLATNVEMPELKLAAAHAALYLAVRYRLRNAQESAYSSLYRAAQLNDRQEDGLRALFWQSVQMERYDTALKAADALSELKLETAEAQLFMVFALYALDRKPEALTEARTFATLPATQTSGAKAEFQALAVFAGLPADSPELAQILEELPA